MNLLSPLVFQYIKELSIPPEKINLSSWEKAKQRTSLVCPLKISSDLLEGTSHNLIVLSQDEEINLVPSEFNANEDMK